MKKNILLLGFMIVIAAVYSSSYAAEIDENACREEIVEVASYLGENLIKESIGTTKFEDLNLSVTDVNNLNSVEQEEIYEKLKSLELIATGYYESLTSEIQTMNAYYFFFADKIEAIRALQVELRAACLPTLK